MTAAIDIPADQAAWKPARATWMLVAVHLAILAVPPIITSFGISGEPATGPPAVALALGLGVLTLQLRHSLAIAGGRRPRGAPWTIVALVVLVYLPLPWFGWSWVPMQSALLASLPMALGGWPLAAALAAPILGTDLAAVRLLAGRQPAANVLFWVLYETFTLVALAAALYGSARLVRVLDELRATRAELAALAVGRERLRISRDLHDLLGQSLAAIALKGDLAIRLLGNDPAAGRHEIESLTGVARQAQAGVRAVTGDQPAVALRTELEGATALLAAAGITASVDVDLPRLPAAVEALLAWTVREGATNVLRHSQACRCWVQATRAGRRVRLVIENDGVVTTAGQGSGLEGLAERARALSGSVAAGATPEGRFRLLVEVPEEGVG